MDTSLFHYHHGSISLFCLIYVDDIIITGSCSKSIQQVIDHLHHAFAIKDLGALHYFIGIEA